MNSFTYATKRGSTALTVPQFAAILETGHWDINVTIDPKQWCMDSTVLSVDDAGNETRLWLSFAGGKITARRQNITVYFNWFTVGNAKDKDGNEVPALTYEQACQFDAPTIDPDDDGFDSDGLTLVSESGGRIKSKQLIRKALVKLNGLNDAVQDAITYKLSMGGSHDE